MSDTNRTDLFETKEILVEMLRDGISLEPMNYLAYVYGPPEWWPQDVEEALPGVLKKVSDDDNVGMVMGSA